MEGCYNLDCTVVGIYFLDLVFFYTMKLGDIILWILFFLSLAVALWYLFGNSPSFEQSVIIFLITAVFGIAINLTRFSTRLESLEVRFNKFERNVTNSFNKIKNDIDLIKKKLKV